MKNRPHIAIPLHPSDRIAEWLGWAFLIGIWAWVLTNYSALPEIIPIHYNGAGEADEFGHKKHILTLPVIASIIFVGLTVLNKFPHVFNYPSEVTAENAYRQYRNATRMLRYLKLVVVLIFGAIAVQTTRHTIEATSGLGTWFLPVMLTLIFAPTFYFLLKMTSGN